MGENQFLTKQMIDKTKPINVEVDVDAGWVTEYFYPEQERQRKMYGYSKEEIIEIVREVLKEEKDKNMKGVVTRETNDKEIEEYKQKIEETKQSDINEALRSVYFSLKDINEKMKNNSEYFLRMTSREGMTDIPERLSEAQEDMRRVLVNLGLKTEE